MTQVNSKRNTTELTESKRSNIYHLKYQNSSPLRVYKKMFLGTLEIKECMLLKKESTHGLPKTIIEFQEIPLQGKARRASISTRL